MAQNVGMVVNSIIFMQLSDTWGRVPVTHVTNLLYIASRILMLFVTHNYIAFLVVIALGSSFFPVGLRAAYTLGAEYTDDRGRLHVYAAGWIWYVFGVAFLALIAWASGEWFLYGMLTIIGNILIIPFWW